MNTSGEERKVPKIVLKFGLNQKPTNVNSPSNESIFSTKAPELVREKDAIIRRIPSISFNLLVKKTNQSIYRSFENFLELSGRMNDIERKKALYQVLSRVKAYYLNLHLLSEWSKISSTHLLIKAFLTEAYEVHNRLHGLDSSFRRFFEFTQTLTLPEPNFPFLKELNSFAQKIPNFFTVSIAGLSFEAKSKSLVGNDEDWTESLDSLLSLEVSKNLPIGEDIEIVSIEKSKCVFIVDALFVFELTLVPYEGKSAWFVLNVEGSEEFKNLFKNGLTGIFQARYNNRLCTEFNIFTSVVLDCKKYVDLFYFEKLFSEFSFLSSLHGRHNIAFFHDGKSKSFQIKPWFMNAPLSIGFSHFHGFEVSSDYKVFFAPKLTFDSQEASHVLLKLFESEYGSKVSNLVESLCIERLAGSFEPLSQSCLQLSMFEKFHVIITLKAVEKSVDVKVANFVEDLSHVCVQVAKSILAFDFNRLSTLMNILATYALKQLFDETSEFKTIECAGVTDATTVVLAKRGSKALIKCSLYSDGKMQLSYLNSTMKSFKGILSLEFFEDASKSEIFKISHNLGALIDSVSSFASKFFELENRNGLTDAITNLGLKGEFISGNTFTIYSQGLPPSLKSINLKETDSSAFEIVFDTVSATYTYAAELHSLAKLLTNIVRIFWIHEASNQLGIESNIRDRIILQLKTKQGLCTISVDHKHDLYAAGPSKQELDLLLHAKEFNVYSLFEILNRGS